MTNISKHPCANKCSEFKAEQCKHCLISCPEISDNSNYSEIPNSSDFMAGDVVVCVSERNTDKLFTIAAYQPTDHYWLDCESLVYKNDIRIATTLELYAGKRLTSDEAVYLNNTLMALREVS